MIGGSQVEAWHRTLLVGSIALISGCAWVMLWQFGAALHGPVHHHHDTAAGFTIALLFVASWTVMTIAMMLPTSLPIVATLQTLAGERPDRSLLMTLVVVGYVVVWAAVGLVFYGGGVLIQQVIATSAWLQAHTDAGSSAILLVAGAYQFTPLKHRCLDKCRSPLTFVLGYWQGQHERRNAFRLGAHHGLFCVGCCWALMLLMFVVGVGNVAWMLLLGGVMAVEKNVSWGRRMSAPLGVALLAGGLGVLMLA